MNKIEYVNEVTVTFTVITSNNKIVERVINKIVKLLNKANIYVHVTNKVSFESYTSLDMTDED